eukprot:2094970-Amphidinium_carterae.1
MPPEKEGYLVQTSQKISYRCRKAVQAVVGPPPSRSTMGLPLCKTSKIQTHSKSASEFAARGLIESFKVQQRNVQGKRLKLDGRLWHSVGRLLV